MEKKKNQKGFTLVEVLIVTVILSTLSAVVIVKFAGGSRDAKEASLKGDLNAMRRQLEAAKVKSFDGDTYPDSLADMTKSETGGGAVGGPYIDKIVPDPFLNVAKEVAAYDGTGGWVYDNVLGDIGANIPTDQTPGDTSWGVLYSEW